MDFVIDLAGARQQLAGLAPVIVKELGLTPENLNSGRAPQSQVIELALGIADEFLAAAHQLGSLLTPAMVIATAVDSYPLFERALHALAPSAQRLLVEEPRLGAAAALLVHVHAFMMEACV